MDRGRYIEKIKKKTKKKPRKNQEKKQEKTKKKDTNTITQPLTKLVCMLNVKKHTPFCKSTKKKINNENRKKKE